MKLTDAIVAKLALPAGKTDWTYWDEGSSGLGLRLREGGSRNWVYQFRLGKRQGKPKIGSWPAMRVADARSAASKMHAKVQLGQNPSAEKARAIATQGETFGALADIYLDRQRQRLRPRSYQQLERHLRVRAKPLHRLPLVEADRRAIAQILAKASASAPVQANRLRASLSGFCSWAVREGLIDVNPVLATNKNDEGGGRERVLDDDELRSIWTATAGDDPYSRIVRLLALTGCRRQEIGALRWSEISFERALISLPGERTKNHRPLEIPLSQPALAILEAQPRRLNRDPVFAWRGDSFTDWSNCKKALDERAQIARPWNLHDMRRSMSTRMHEDLAIAPHIVEACLGHVGHQGGVAGRYNKSRYGDEKRRAFNLWAEHLASIIEGRPAKVLAFTGRPVQ